MMSAMAIMWLLMASRYGAVHCNILPIYPLLCHIRATLYFRIYLYLCIETADVQAARALSVRQHSEVSHAGALLLLAGSHIYL